MGYEIVLKNIKWEDIDNKFKPTSLKRPDESELNASKVQFVAECLNTRVNKDHKLRFEMKNIYDDLITSLYFLALNIKEHWAWRIKSELVDNEEIYRCGWNHSENSGNEDSPEDILNKYMEVIFYFVSTIPSVDWYEDEDKWYKHKEYITDVVDDFIGEYEEALDNEFFYKYRNDKNTEVEESY